MTDQLTFKISTMKEITSAIIAVMAEIEGIEKNMEVGSGAFSYKGVADKDVKQVIGKSMVKNGLCILPTGIIPTVKIERWEEFKKTKQQVFVEVLTTYKILHVSGESIDIAGYGHGVDPQDKAAGKALTYALKNALLYTFLVPTGNIDDTDRDHSEKFPVGPVGPVAPGIDPLEIAGINACTTNEQLTALWRGTRNDKQVLLMAEFSRRKQELLNDTI